MFHVFLKTRVTLFPNLGKSNQMDLVDHRNGDDKNTQSQGRMGGNACCADGVTMAIASGSCYQRTNSLQEDDVAGNACARKQNTKTQQVKCSYVSCVSNQTRLPVIDRSDSVMTTLCLK